MCWVSNKIPNLKYAERDLCVFKIIKDRSEVTSYFMDFVYEPNKEYTTELGKVTKQVDYYVVREGFHSYSLSALVPSVFYNYLERSAGIRILPFIIPRGAEYYKNEWGIIVSNKIKYVIK